MMIRAALAALFCSELLAAAPKPIVRAIVSTPRPIIVGQAVRLDVTVLVPNYFTGAPEFPQINLEDAIVVSPQETPRNSNETISGQTFAGIGVTYLIYPQQPGTIKLPPAEIDVKYASDPPRSVEIRLPLPSVAFNATIPPEAADLDYFLPTTSLTITQKFDKPVQNFKVGDTFRRTVTVSASRLRAMLIPPATFDAPDGVAVYPVQPAVDDMKTDRGEFVGGRRIDSATYLIRKEGGYTLPELRVEWWNLTARRVQTARLPSIHFTAGPNPAYHPELAPEPEPPPVSAAPKTKPLRYYIRLAEIAALAIATLAILLWAWLRLGPRLRRRWHDLRRARENSEAAAFRKLQKACRAGRAKDAYALLLVWLNRFSSGMPLGQFLSNSHDTELAREIEVLTSELYGRSMAGSWSGKRMLPALQRVRSRHQQVKRQKSRLPPLNPQTRPYT